MDVRALDLGDDRLVDGFYDVSWRAEIDDGRPWNGHWTRDELLAELREAAGDHRMEGLAVLDGDQVVGAGVLGYALRDNLDKAWIFPMVDPPRRGHGAGGLLVEALLARCRELGRATVSMSASVAAPEDPDAPAFRFARAHGFHLSYSEINRRLSLPVDPALLDSLHDESARHWDGYDIQTYVDGVPDELLESWCALDNLLGVDSPSGQVDYEPAAMTPDNARERFALNTKVGRQVFHAVAVRHGEAVAMSDIAVQPDLAKGLQWSTYVHRQHRGHRLGTAVKVANLRQLQARRPDVRSVETSNAETNQHMVSINEALGFEIFAVSPQFVLTQEV